ncbi:SURP and G-patch domain-containing protein 1-like isoform X2 [Daphnia pulex]|uniref:SURP and G-patch domain-containing protein 1-like isoform X2 n=1 Tax=Daphnia pulex TaxID=6669 RepID=UPI001EE0A7CE|nr:SURP and G-patch domain-containing protein 1-like isoform X2 [Daphnia pulex]
MSSPRGSGNFKNVRKNAREQRLQFMNSQAALIAQKKKEIEEKLAQQQLPQKEVKVEPKIEIQEVIPNGQEEAVQLPPKTPVLPFKNDGSFLEKFRQMQQQNAKSDVQHSGASQSLQADYSCPPPIDVSVPPPHSLPNPYYTQHPPPPSYLSAPPPMNIKEETKEENRSPSPYSPSRPCEDEDDLPFFNKDYHHQGPSNSSEDSGNFSQSGLRRKFKEEPDDSENSSKLKERERKRQSRWGPQEVKIEPPTINPVPISNVHMGFDGPSTTNQTVLGRSSFLSRITSADPQILTYAVRVFGTTDLTEDQWKQCLDQVKMQYVYQEMLKKKQERDRLAQVGKVRYEYDSDEETEGGTWEHKRRKAEMEKTKDRADQLTECGRGKHHLGDFLPPEELAKFMEKFQAVQEGRTVDESDYKEFKIAEDNVGYQMLKKFGWTEGEGLGIGGSGITTPVNATRRNEAQGLGAIKPEDLTSNDNEYDAYRKRMMLAYRFRPNPLNNPRRAYY